MGRRRKSVEGVELEGGKDEGEGREFWSIRKGEVEMEKFNKRRRSTLAQNQATLQRVSSLT